MKLAVLSDIHGNYDALQAVLLDLSCIGGADYIWVLGDLAAFGPQPAECIDAVRELKAAQEVKVIQGNTDRYLVTGVRPPMPKPSEENWGSMAEMTRQRDAMFTWTLDRLNWSHAEYLMKLETDLALEVENYGWVIGFHAIPGDDEAIVILPDAPDYEIKDALLDREGHLAVCGHTHQAMNRQVDNWRVINPGSLGLPYDGDPRAPYAMLTFVEGKALVEMKRVPYDVDAALKKLRDFDHPAVELMTHRLRDAAP